jgi:4-amino-4-deoxy-L-arabinose transferase-like glycosyltransferase
MNKRSNHSRLKQHYRLILLSILLLSFALRVYRLEYQSLRGDEGLTYVYSVRPLAELFEIMRVTSPHPPVYYTSIHGWLKLAGDTEFALRFPSTIAGVFLVASTAALGRMVFDAKLGLLAALLVTLNPYQILYAQDARSYPLITSLGVLSTISLLLALRGDTWRYWITYGLIMLAALFTHYYAILIAIFHGLYLLYVSWRRRRFPWRYAAIGLVDILLFTPWLVYSWGLLSSYAGAGETTMFVGSIWRPLMAFAGGQLILPRLAWINAVTIPLLLCLGTIGLWQKRRSRALMIVLYLTVPLVSVFLASQFKPYFNERYLILASPAFYLLIGAGLIWLLSFRRPRSTFILLVLATVLLTMTGVALSNYYFNPQFAKSPPWREVLGYITGKAQPGDALVYTAPLPPILYYNQDRLPAYLVPYEPYTPFPEAVKQLENVLQNHPRVWLLPLEADGEASLQMEPWLDRHSVRLDQTFFRVLHIGLYQAPNAFQETMTPQPARFSDGLRLNGFRLGNGQSPLVTPAGEDIALTLVWYAERPPALAYTVFTHLVGPDGALWGQWDNPPVWGAYPTTEWAAGETIFDQYLIPVKENAPPGKYRLLVGFYDPVTGARLPVLDAQGQTTGDSVQLDQAIIVQARGN